jgi:hypothetical protein
MKIASGFVGSRLAANCDPDLPALATRRRVHERVVNIDPLELETAQERDAARA